MAKTRKDRIANIELEMERLENQRKQLMEQEKAAARKERNSRLCRRMGLFESILPDTIALDEERFKAFLIKTVANDFGKKTLATFITEQSAHPIANGADKTSPLAATPDANRDKVTAHSGAKYNTNDAGATS
jgi:hypothetical protein